MRPSLLQIEGFAPDAPEVREAVIGQGFGTEKGPDGLDYTGICRHEVPHWHDLIAQAVGRPITMKLSFFRLTLKDELPHCWVHSDELCQAKMAGLLYLNLPGQCTGGTAFWRHTALEVEALPGREELAQRGINAEWYYRMMNREWKDLTFWAQVGFVGMRFNRFITYPVSRFHSRYPFEGFGQTPQDARLVWTCFYD